MTTITMHATHDLHAVITEASWQMDDLKGIDRVELFGNLIDVFAVEYITVVNEIIRYKSLQRALTFISSISKNLDVKLSQIYNMRSQRIGSLGRYSLDEKKLFADVISKTINFQKQLNNLHTKLNE